MIFFNVVHSNNVCNLKRFYFYLQTLSTVQIRIKCKDAKHVKLLACRRSLNIYSGYCAKWIG